MAKKLLKSLLAAYVLTGLLLLVTAFFLYKFSLSEEFVTGAIIAIYVLTTFTGGFVMGKLTKTKKFLWGFLVGLLYYVILLLITLGIYRSLDGGGENVITTLLLCAGGGMLGGMLS